MSPRKPRSAKDAAQMLEKHAVVLNTGPATPGTPIVTQVADGIVKKLYDACTEIGAARKLNAQMCAQFAPGSAAYAQCQLIDDRLHNALVALGE